MKGSRKTILAVIFMIGAFAFGLLCVHKGVDLVGAAAYLATVGATIYGTGRELTKEHAVNTNG